MPSSRSAAPSTCASRWSWYGATCSSRPRCEPRSSGCVRARSTIWPRPRSCPPRGSGRARRSRRSPARPRRSSRPFATIDPGDARVHGRLPASIFGDAPESPQREDTPCRPTTPYAIAKLAAHQLVGALRAHDGAARQLGHRLQPRVRAPARAVRHAQDHARRGRDRARPARQELTLGDLERRARLVVRRRHHARRLADAPAGSPRRLRARQRRAAHRRRAGAGGVRVRGPRRRAPRARRPCARAPARGDAERGRPQQGARAAGLGAAGRLRGSSSSAWCRPTCARCRASPPAPEARSRQLGAPVHRGPTLPPGWPPSASSDSATSACRSPSPSRRRAATSSASTSTRARSRRSTPATPTSRTSPPSCCESVSERIHATTRYARLAKARRGARSACPPR